MLLILVGCLLAGCDDSPTTVPATSEDSVSQSGDPTGDPATPGPRVEPAVEDLATRLGVNPTDITVVSSEEVTWRDASLGCPEPGRMYAQVLTPGVRIVLEVNGRHFDYHAAAGKPPFLCENPQPPA